MSPRTSTLSALAFFSLATVSLPASALKSGATAGSTALDELAIGGSGSPRIPGTTGIVDQFTGTFNYDVPIQVVPGRHGMQPQVQLHYRSSNGDGPLGVGWELELGAIERRTKGGVVYSGANQKFVLRSSGFAADLVPVGGNEYRAQLESGAFLRIRQLTAADGLVDWEVTDRNGTRSLYGQTDQSRQKDGLNQAFRWSIDSVQDIDGNTISYAYSGTLPAEIDYAGHISGLAAGDSVVFHWSFVLGGLKLSSIDSNANDANGVAQLVRRYKLNYTVSGITGRVLLASVTQYGKDGSESLPPIAFDWSAPDTGFLKVMSPSNYGGWSAAGNSIRTADINGDGYDDAIIGPDASGSWFVMLGSAQGLINVGAKLTGYLGNWSGDSTALQHIWTGDFNGDGKQDIIIGPDNSLQNGDTSAGSWTVLEWNGTGFTRIHAASNAYSGWFGHAPRIRPFDVDGDGKTDIRIGPDSNGTWYLLHSNGQTFDDWGPYISNAYGGWDADDTQNRVAVADVTGDGLPDIVLRARRDWHSGTSSRTRRTRTHQPGWDSRRTLCTGTPHTSVRTSSTGSTNSPSM